MIKAILKETYTKRDISGNVYITVMIMNPKTRNSFTVYISSLGIVEHTIKQIFQKWNWTAFYSTSECTNSTKLSSLPIATYMYKCRSNKEWVKALRSIGYRIPHKTKETI